MSPWKEPKQLIFKCLHGSTVIRYTLWHDSISTHWTYSDGRRNVIYNRSSYLETVFFIGIVILKVTQIPGNQVPYSTTPLWHWFFIIEYLNIKKRSDVLSITYICYIMLYCKFVAVNIYQYSEPKVYRIYLWQLVHYISCHLHWCWFNIWRSSFVSLWQCNLVQYLNCQNITIMGHTMMSHLLTMLYK